MNISRRSWVGSALASGGILSTGGMMSYADQPAPRGHVVLLGDSIFDNKPYVGSNPAVIDQLRSELPAGWTGTLLAVDGNMIENIAEQLDRLPADASHLVVSIGGNDAVMESAILNQRAKSAAEVFLALAAIRHRFDQGYRRMLEKVVAKKLPTTICTIYDPNFTNLDQQRMCVVGLNIFNDCITRAAARHGLPIVDLRTLITAKDDYANAIEPSSTGGAKIARLIKRIVTEHDFAGRHSVLYS